MYRYDLVFPMAGVPIGTLRHHCTAWRENPQKQKEGTLPFLILGQEVLWQKSATYYRDFLNVDRLYALFPRFDLWDKPFTEWTPEDWQTCGLSALWNIITGEVLWAEGAYPADQMPGVGLPINKFLEVLGKKA